VLVIVVETVVPTAWITVFGNARAVVENEIPAAGGGGLDTFMLPPPHPASIAHTIPHTIPHTE
jgi:hypothetical protein